MPEAYDLTKMLEEIIEDEKECTSKRKKISQADIKKMLLERQKAPMKTRSPEAMRLGEALAQQGLVGADQIKEALRVQTQKGGKIGSILVTLGHISAEQLLQALGRHFGVPGVDLFQLNTSENLTSILPLRVMMKYRVMPVKVERRSVNLAMEDPNDHTAIHEVEFLTGRRVIPVVVPAYQMDLAIKCVQDKGGRAFSGAQILSASSEPMNIESMLQFVVEANASDLFITAGAPPSVKVQNTLKRSPLPALAPDQCVAYGKALMTGKQWEDFLRKKELDFAIEYDGIGRFRVSAYRQKNSISVALRCIPNEIPSFDTLGIPRWVEDFVMKPQGLILVTSPAGHGRTTTVSAMIDLINTKRGCNIITLEDPIEYVHKPRNSNINQREVGSDTESFAEGLRRIFRQAPDVILVGDMCDRETVEIALKAASTGHLVLSTMQTPNSTAAIDGIVNSFPDHLRPQVRQQLTDALLLIFAQRLLPKRNSEVMVLAWEKLINSYRIKNFIRDNKVHQIRAQIQSEADDYASIDVSLVRLVKDGRLSLENALPFADSSDYVMKMVR